MRAIELTIKSHLFTVTHERINVHSIKAIERDGDGILIKTGYSTKLKLKEDDTAGVDGSQTYYFELSDAQKAQIRGRKALIAAKFEEVQKIQNKYNELIQLWFHEPAHDPFKKEISE